MDPKTKVSRLLSLSSDNSIGDKLLEILNNKKEFTVFHSFEPNGHLTLAHALVYAIASKIIKECGGKYIIFISDVRSSQEGYFKDYENPFDNVKKEDQNLKDKKEKKAKKQKLSSQDRKVLQENCIKKSYEYALNILEKLGAIGPHVKILKSSEFSLDNYDLFYQMVSNSASLSLNDVKGEDTNNSVPSSQLIAPCLHITEIQFLKADIVLCPENHSKQFNILNKIMPNNEIPVVIPIHQIMNLKNSNPPRPDPKNYYFFEDNSKIIQQKTNGAFCTDDVNGNPVFQYISFIFLPFYGQINLNGKEYTSVQEIAKDFPSIDKKTLKESLAGLVEKTIEPLRDAIKHPNFHNLSDVVSTFNPTVQ